MEEEWRDIKGYEGLYQVSNTGKLRSLNYRKTGREKLLKPQTDKNGYLFVGIRKNGKRKFKKIHRLVAETFIPNPNNYPCVNHKSEIKTQNNVENLEWCDHKYNTNYGTRNIRSKISQSKTVVAYKNGVEVLRFSSTAEAQRNGYNSGNISCCCRGIYKQYKGYKWQYKKGDY